MIKQNVLLVRWFSGGKGTVGIVVAEDTKTKERKAYIGAVEGYSELVDIDYILSWGAKVPLSMIEEIEKELKGK